MMLQKAGSEVVADRSVRIEEMWRGNERIYCVVPGVPIWAQHGGINVRAPNVLTEKSWQFRR